MPIPGGLTVPILMYHKVAPRRAASHVAGHYVSPGAFRRQMRSLRLLGYRGIPINALDEARSRDIGITFDDGYADLIKHVRPVLANVGYRATFYIVTGRLGGRNDWDEGMEGLLDADKVRLLQAEGHEIGSHTADHLRLTDIEDVLARRQIVDSRAYLQNAFGVADPTFCYPYGSLNPKIQAMVRDAGYRYACSTRKGANTAGTDPWALGRINVRADTGLPVLWAKIIRDRRRPA